MKPQTKKIYKFLIKRRSNKVTSLTAVQKFGCISLAKRICEIKEHIKSTPVLVAGGFYVDKNRITTPRSKKKIIEYSIHSVFDW
jgi:hypothetical protein